MMGTVEDKITKAKVSVLQDSIFFSSLLFSLETELTSDHGNTIATDGRKIYIHPSFAEDTTVSQLVGALLHEVLHVALDSFGRRKHREFVLWNIATDYAINLIVTDSNFELPPGILLDRQYENKTAEQIYDIILKKAKITQQEWGQGDILNSRLDKEKLSQQAKEMLVQAQTACDVKGQGAQVPKFIRAHIGHLLNPKLPWNIILQSYLEEYQPDDHSWNRPRRCYLPTFYLPARFSPAISHLVVARDTSGSITRQEERVQLTEIQSIRDTFSLDRLTIYGVSTCIDNKYEIEPNDDILSLKFSSHGGTSFNSFFSEIAQDPPTILIFFSDLRVRFDWPPPTYDVIWINTGKERRTPKDYGRTIQYR